MEHQANLLWINSDSSYNIHEKWLQNNFKKNQRAQILLVKNDNVLTPESINLVSNRCVDITTNRMAISREEWYCGNNSHERR